MGFFFILHPTFYLKKKVCVKDVHVSVCLMSVRPSVRPSVCLCLSAKKSLFNICIVGVFFLTTEGNISEFFKYIFSLCH